MYRKDHVNMRYLYLTSSVPEWLQLVTLIHVARGTGGSKWKPWFGLGMDLGRVFSQDLSHGSHLLLH